MRPHLWLSLPLCRSYSQQVKLQQNEPHLLVMKLKENPINIQFIEFGRLKASTLIDSMTVCLLVLDFLHRFQKRQRTKAKSKFLYP